MDNGYSGTATCNACGYDLHGLSLDGACPECGRPVADSLRGIELRFAAPDYLATLRGGITLYLAVSLLELLVAFLSWPLATSIGARNPAGIEAIFSMAGVMLSIVAGLGFVKFTSPDPGLLAAEQPRNARRLARVGMLLIIGGAVIRFIIQMTVGGTTMTGLFPGMTLTLTTPTLSMLMASVINAAGFLLFFFQGLRYASWLFGRVPDVQGVRLCGTAMWALPLIAILGLCVCIGPVIAKVLHLLLLWRLRGHLESALKSALRPQRLATGIVVPPEPPPQDPSSGRQP